MSVNTTNSFEGGIIRSNKQGTQGESSPIEAGEPQSIASESNASDSVVPLSVNHDNSPKLPPTTPPDTNAEPSTATHASDVNETTRLLSPDDPIVSPLNLPTIIMLRQLTYYLLIINTVILIFLILSHFITFSITPSFRDINFQILTVGYNFLTLWYFQITGTSERNLGIVVVIFLIIDIFVIGFKLHGVLAPIYTSLNIVYSIVTESYVFKSKTYQEIKYTGRPETRMTVFEMLITSIKFFIKFIILLLIISISCFVWLNAFDTHLTGNLISINNINLHLECFGETTNGVLLVESGLKSSSESYTWIDDMYRTNQILGYCVFDRPGYGLSDYSPTTISMSAEYLNLALREQGIKSVNVVAYDIGGLYAQVLTTHGIVDGIVFIDAWHNDLLTLTYPFKEKFDLVEVPSAWNGFKIWCKGMISPLGWKPLAHLIHPKKYDSWSRVFGDDMVYSGKYLLTRLQNQLTTKWSSNEIPVDANVKTMVLSSDKLLKSKNWSEWQRQLTKWGNCLDWVILDKPGKQKDALKRFLDDDSTYN